ncbi:MAG TPA: ABC transporter ATP-binding protein [Mesorhizobium sp.]|jgi:peptide/nickel transport system ATP-binding protein|nr:ABC transporter ATP-binding protein [Mesorhizobium sp.]
MMRETVPPLLDISGLSVAFGAHEVVRDVSFSVGAGEAVGLVGESGSGKSITCRAVLGLLPRAARASGQVLFDGADLLALSPAEMQLVRGRKISMIFQNPSSHLDPLMTAGAQVAEPLRRHLGQPRRTALGHAVEILRSVRINEPERRLHAYPHELSGGMKQRVLIGSAMACGPRLLLADEPTTALDVTVQARILELMRELNHARGVSILLVSHDLGVVAEMCSRVVVMRNGAVVEDGPARDILRAPKHPYTQLLIESQPAVLPLPAVSRAEASDAAPLVEVKRLSVEFFRPGLLPGRRKDVVKAVDDVSFDVRPGENFAIVGESGSGKSTIARVVMGLERPVAGEVLYRGRPVASLDADGMKAFRRKAQMIFQNPFDSLNPAIRVADAIAEPLIRHGLLGRAAARARALDLMGQVELPEALAERRPGQLSGGQCQRVGIARALALDPELVIADEITSALDVTIQAQILRLLDRLRTERGLTVITISHDLHVVRRFCDRVAVLRAGRLVETGPVEEVLTSPREDYTRDLVRSAPRLDLALEREAAEA